MLRQFDIALIVVAALVPREPRPRAPIPAKRIALAVGACAIVSALLCRAVSDKS